MSEYIIHHKDAETLYEHTDFPFLLEEYLREEIVRCRDCKYYEDYIGRCVRRYHPMAVTSDGFCKWGERDDGQTE